MSPHEQITQAVYEAIDEVNTMPIVSRPLERSPGTVLIGDNGQLDSLGFVAFMMAIEKRVQCEFDRAITAMDLFTEEMEKSCTVADLVHRIVESVGHKGVRPSGATADG